MYIYTTVKKASSTALALTAALFFITTSLSCGVGPLRIKDQPEEQGGAAPTMRVNYFFDRTESMRGFTRSGDDAAYVKTLPLLWQAAEIAFPLREEHFFEYGATSTNEFKDGAQSSVKRDVLRGDFYNSEVRSEARTEVKKNGGQPFTSVAEYIKTPGIDNGISIIVTDLYEQNREDPFSSFFREAFARGHSGAFFAVESSFQGEVHSVSRINVEEKSITVNSGKSTFFICIAGKNIGGGGGGV
jgi:hypothetical protein